MRWPDIYLEHIECSTTLVAERLVLAYLTSGDLAVCCSTPASPHAERCVCMSGVAKRVAPMMNGNWFEFTVVPMLRTQATSERRVGRRNTNGHVYLKGARKGSAVYRAWYIL